MQENSLGSFDLMRFDSFLFDWIRKCGIKRSRLLVSGCHCSTIAGWISEIVEQQPPMEAMCLDFDIEITSSVCNKCVSFLLLLKFRRNSLVRRMKGIKWMDLKLKCLFEWKSTNSYNECFQLACANSISLLCHRRLNSRDRMVFHSCDTRAQRHVRQLFLSNHIFYYICYSWLPLLTTVFQS